MIEEHRVWLECEADTLMVWFILRKWPNHHQGLPKVSTRLEEKGKKSPRQKIVAVIDNDKRKTNFINKSEPIQAEHNLELRQLKNTNHFIIVIDPGLEEWLLNIAKKNEIDAGRYGFHTAKKLESACKSIKAHKDQNVKQFFNTLQQKQVSGFQTLRKWLHDILS